MADPGATKPIAERLHGSSLVSVGTSGFSYRDWKGVLYPEWLRVAGLVSLLRNQVSRRGDQPDILPATDGEDARTVEAVRADRIRVCAQGQPVDHASAASCPLRRRPGADARRLCSLGRQLTSILFQLPPSLGADHERLKRFIDLVARGLESTPLTPALAFEFRNASWNTLETLDLLTRRGCGMVLHDMRNAGDWQWNEGTLKAGKLSLSVPALVTLRLPLLYLRFHGTTGKYGGEYSQQGLGPWAALARCARERQIPLHAYFNNTQAGAAVHDALRFAEMLQA